LTTSPTSDAQKTAELDQLALQLERAQALEAEFRAFADSARDYAFITLALDKTVVGWNKGAELLLGYSVKEILGRPGTVFFTPEDVAQGGPEQELSTALRDGRAEDERWHMRKDGTKFWGSGVVTPLTDAAGQVRGYAKVMRDRTEERKSQEDLRIREERLRLLLENIRDCAVFDLNLSGEICVWNPGAERIFGYTEGEALGVDATEFFSAAGYSSEAFRQELEIALQSGRGEGESWLTRKNGARFYARWITNAVRTDGGEAIGFIKILRDETSRQESEDEERRRSEYAWDLVEQQARATSSALSRTNSELVDIGRRLLNVQEGERRRIARELHDHLAQRLALLAMGLDRLRQGLPGDLAQLRSDISSLQEQTASLSQDVRDISHRLHPSILEHLGLVKALRALCDDYQRNRTAPVVFEAVEDGVTIPTETAAAFYRICEEALRNIQKHAGDVRVTVQVHAKSTHLQLRIQDEGPGFDPQGVNCAEHLGLVSMLERASLVGAVCKCISRPGDGTTIQVRLIT
jgi:PAS domain S-box-containing protein